jgi:hypothetical protein
VEALTVKRALKDDKTNEKVHLELDAKKRSNLALQQQVTLLSTRLKAMEELALATAQTYIAELGEFGGSTSALLEEQSTFNLLSWLKTLWLALQTSPRG